MIIIPEIERKNCVGTLRNKKLKNIFKLNTISISKIIFADNLFQI